MIGLRRSLAILLFSSFCINSIAQEYKNDITLPSKQYMLQGVENRMYIQTFLKRNGIYGDIVRFGGSTKYPMGGRLENVAIVDEAVTGNTIKVDLIDGEEFEVQKSVKSVIVAGEPYVGEAQVAVQFLGDSYTRGVYFKDAFLDKGYVPKVKLIGTRYISGYEGQAHEGRGGWTLQKYFSNNESDSLFYNPFWQPDGEYKYWGNTVFWRTAIDSRGKEGLSFNVKYNCDGYDLSRFGADGKLLNPQTGDVMYDGDKEVYIAWTRKGWKEIDKPQGWSFDYAKYLDLWELESPKFLVVMLGLNDFRNLPMPIDFSEWNAMVDRVLASYKEAVPDGRLLLCTPCTSCGTLNNERGTFTTLQNATMWTVRKNIIDTFDAREQDGLYVVDASITIDNENGYNTKDGVQLGSPHPYPNYPELAVPIAAFVQYYRDL